MKFKEIFSSEIVKEIEGIGPNNGKILAAAGIRTLDDLRRADTNQIHQATRISARQLTDWKSAATLRQVIGIDRQIAEVLVKSGIRDLLSLRNAHPKNILKVIEDARKPRKKYNIIPDTYARVITLEKVLMWQCSINVSSPGITQISSPQIAPPFLSSNVEDVEIYIDRDYETRLSTMGSLFIAGRWLYTLEPPDRNNAATNEPATAGRIFPGSYPSFVRTDGSHGWCVELNNVPGRSNIQIHRGNFPKDTTGCILVGLTRENDWVKDSVTAMGIIQSIVESAGEKPAITVHISGIPISEPPPQNPPSSGGGGGW